MSDLARITAEVLLKHYDEKYPAITDVARKSLQAGLGRKFIMRTWREAGLTPNMLNDLSQALDLIIEEHANANCNQ